MSYQEKYLKYKKKYITLKNMIGGNYVSNRKFTIMTILKRLFKATSRNVITFKKIINDNELKSRFGTDKATELITFFNTNINESILGPLYAGTFDADRDSNTNSKRIFNQLDLSKNNLIELYYNLSPNSLIINCENSNINSIKLLDEKILNVKLNEMIDLYANIDDSSRYYSNGIVKPDSIINLPESTDPYYAQKITVPSDAKIHYIGDIHGSLMSLLKIIIDSLGYAFSENLILKPNNYLIFTGDIVDYSQLGLECLYLICMLKLKNPDKVYICDGNHEDHNMYVLKSHDRRTPKIYLGHELNNEITSAEIKKNVHKMLKLFPAVIFVNYKDSIFQYNHGSHPSTYVANMLKLKEYLSSDKEYLYLGSATAGRIFYEVKGFSFKWGDFIQKQPSLIRRSIERPARTLIETQDYLSKFGINCILSGHQDVVPLTVLANREINNTDAGFADILHKYQLSTNYYNLLGFPPIKNLGGPNAMKNKNYMNKRDNIVITVNAEGKTNGMTSKLPTEDSYLYVFHPSDLNKDGTKTELPNRILAMTTSTAGMSHGKSIEYIVHSTLF